jgi:hypothetical protein
MFSDTHRVRLGQGDFSCFGVYLSDIIDNLNVAPGLVPGALDPDAWHKARRYILPENAERLDPYCRAAGFARFRFGSAYPDKMRRLALTESHIMRSQTHSQCKVRSPSRTT